MFGVTVMQKGAQVHLMQVRIDSLDYLMCMVYNNLYLDLYGHYLFTHFLLNVMHLVSVPDGNSFNWFLEKKLKLKKKINKK